MIDTSRPVYTRANGDYVAIRTNGDPARISVSETPGEHKQIADAITAGEITATPEPVYAPTADELAAIARAARNVALAEHDRLVQIALRDQRAGDAVAMARLEALDAYAKALCDWPSTPGFPDIATMPKLKSN